MIGYTTIGARDLDRALTFYDALLAEVGGKQLMGIDRLKIYGSGEGCMLAVCTPYNGEQQSCGNGVMVAITAGSPEGADRLYAKAMELGASCEGEPGQRMPHFYAAYVRDLDGNKLCFYHMETG